jgi:triosephosphate isomerase (TIM)
MALSNNIPFIAGNWKMFKTNPEAVDLVSDLINGSEGLLDGAEMVVIPPFTALYSVFVSMEKSGIKLGGQNLHWEDEGAFTGEISAPLLKSVGCQFVVIGHSERRQYFGETNQTVNKKIKAALKHEITPIVCIGESNEQREKNQTKDHIFTQIEEGLAGLEEEQAKKIIIAYEPIWAIGTGLTATPEQAEEVHAFIRKRLEEKYGKDTASCAIILYGGSVKPANTYSLLKEKDINGALIGGASLEAESFLEITKQAIEAYKEKWAQY